MAAVGTTVPHTRPRIRPLQVIGIILLVPVAVVVAFVLWTVYENTFTPAASGPASTLNAQPTPPGTLSPTAARALKAYGGEEVWKNATTVETVATVGGALFQAKGTNIPPHAKFSIDIRNARTTITPFDANGDIGVLDGYSLTIQSADGKIIEQRADARSNLQNASLTTHWDQLNLLYFLGYAFWGYNTLPYQLTRSDIQWTELQDGVLQADFGDLPAHSRVQRYWFDTQTGLLKRNDYTPLAAARDAHAANIVFDYGVFNGIPYPTKRRVQVTPVQEYGWVLPFPDFVTIDVDSWQLR